VSASAALRRPAGPAPETGAAPRRVLFFIAYPQRMAGANRSLFELVTNLPPEVEPHVLVVGEGEVVDLYRRAGIPCVILSPGDGALAGFGKVLLKTSRLQRARIALAELLPYTLRLRRHIREGGFDLVHVNDPRGALLAAPAARLAGRPVVAHLRGEFPFGPAVRAVFERAGARIVAVSEGARRTLSPAGQRRAVTVYNGIRPLPHPAGRLPWLAGLRERGVVVVGCFASVVPFKGQHHLLRAAALLRERGLGGDRVAFVSVGDLVREHGAYHDWLRQLTAELGVDNVTFAGWQDDPFPFYAHVDVSVLPSVSRERLVLGGREVEVRGNEGFPRTHLEAMQMGIPVVGTAIAGVPEQVADGETGFVVPPADPAALADALERLVRSAELRASMGRAGRERVERLFSTPAYVRGVMDVYREVWDG
jgi:glycosyltransferase involved in cell wall biosynthesis